LDHCWDSVHDGTARGAPYEIDALSEKLIQVLSEERQEPVSVDFARIWKSIEQEMRADEMSATIAFPHPAAIRERAASRPGAASRFVAIAATLLLLLSIAGLAYRFSGPDGPKRLPAIVALSPEAEPAIDQFLIDWAAARSSGDVNKLSEFYVSPDIHFDDFALGLVATNRGQFRGWMADIATLAGHPTYVITGGFVDGDHAVAEWTMSGSDEGFAITGGPHSGNPFVVRGVSVFELRDGKIAVQRDYYDLYGVLHQIQNPVETPTPAP
jgi:steroid delta-isomerase-like uncharacterized protein